MIPFIFPSQIDYAAAFMSRPRSSRRGQSSSEICSQNRTTNDNDGLDDTMAEDSLLSRARDSIELLRPGLAQRAPQQQKPHWYHPSSWPRSSTRGCLDITPAVTTTAVSFVDVPRAHVARRAPDWYRPSSWPQSSTRGRRDGATSNDDAAGAKRTRNTIAHLTVASAEAEDARDPPPYTKHPHGHGGQLQPVMREYAGDWRVVYKVPIIFTHCEKHPPEYAASLEEGDQQALRYPAICDVLSIPAHKLSAAGLAPGFGERELLEAMHEVRERHVEPSKAFLDGRCEIRMVKIGKEGLEEVVLQKGTCMRELGKVLRFGRADRAPTICLRVDWWWK